MQSTFRGIHGAAVLALLAAVTAGCGVSEQESPALIGPSGFAQSVTLTASPDRLPRDGNSQSLVTITVRNSAGQPVAGQRLTVRSTNGSASQGEVTTGADGRATVTVTAPSSSIPSATSTIEVFATPIAAGTGEEMSATRSISIALTGTANTTEPTPAFTASPSAPSLRETVVFDASGTRDEERACNDACTYTWDFGGEATATGRVVTHRFQTVRIYPVTLTVRDSAGSSAALTQNVTVVQGAAPTATFTYSPTQPAQFESVFFSAAESQVGVAGRTITSYEWRFGDGATASGVNATHAYNVLGTYPVILTITDSAGVQSTTIQNVTVVNGLTAGFTVSPTNPDTTDSVIFDAEASRGSSTGFGARNPIVEYIWDFGDPNSPGTVTTNSRIIQHRYTAARTYTVVLTVVDSAGRRATTSQTLTVAAP